MKETYYLDQDGDGHWYVVPLSKETEWEIWLALDPENEDAWEPPEGVVRVGGWQGNVKFSDFKID